MGKNATAMRHTNECNVKNSSTEGNKGPQWNIQGYKFIMTWNNYPDDGLFQITNKLVPYCSKWVFGLEVGEQGTPHIQGGFIMDGQTKTRFSSIFRKFGWKPEDDKLPFFLRRMKGDWYDQKYCLKEGTAISNDKFFLERKRTLRKTITQLRGWQQHVINRLNQPADERTIIYCNLPYKSGKTSLVHYLNDTYGAVLIDGEKRHLLAQVENNKKADVFIYYQPADGGRIPWDAIESIKDGIFASHFGTKNNGMCKIEHYIHLVIFSNRKLEDNLWGYHIDKERFINITG